MEVVCCTWLHMQVWGVRARRWHISQGTCVGALARGVAVRCCRAANASAAMRSSALSKYWRKEDIIWIRALCLLPVADPRHLRRRARDLRRRCARACVRVSKGGQSGTLELGATGDGLRLVVVCHWSHLGTWPLG